MILERSEITAFPSSQTVINGDIAIFQCNAKGSNISVRWNFNGSFCGLDSCEHYGIYIDRTQDTDLMINSTLEIRTGELHSFIIEKIKYTIQCIVEQNLDSSSPRNNITIILTVHPQSNAPRNNITTTLTVDLQSDAPRNNITITDPKQVIKLDGEYMHTILCLYT